MTRVGIVLLPQHRWAEAAPRWRRAEELGFDHAWTYDHLAWRSLADEPWFATVPTLTAAATVTSRIRLGTWVASPNYRHPVTFGKDLMTLDDISDGRFVLGVGAGGTGLDATVLGGQVLPPRQRVDRLTEFLDHLDVLLREPVSDLTGDWYAAVGARMRPGGVQQPRLPFVVAANGPRTMRLALRHGAGWATTGPEGTEGEAAWWDGVAGLVRRFEELQDEVGGGPVDRYLSLDTAAYALDSVEHLTDMTGRAAALGFTDVVTHWPRPEGVYAGAESVLDEVGQALPHLRAM